MRARRSVVLVTVLLAALLGGAAEGFLPHTDDGCPTETHCLVCRTVQGRTAAVVGAVSLVAVALAAEVVPAPPAPRLVCAASRPHLSRGPPASC